MAFPKHITIACVLLALTGLLLGCGEDTTVAPAPESEAPILAPVNVRIFSESGNLVIEWDANTQAHLRGYNVYRLDRENYEIGRLNTTEITTNRYVDWSAQTGHRYDYRVTSVSLKGAESAYSVVTILYESGPHHKKGLEND